MIGLGLDIPSIATRSVRGTDPLAPAAPTIDLAAASDSGSSNTDNITSDTTPTFTVTGDLVENDTLTFYVDDVAQTPHVITAGEALAGTLDLQLDALAEGARSINAKLTRDGHTSAFSNTIGATIDTTAPTITSGTTANNVENIVLSHALTANETVVWTITGGADQAQFEISGSTLRWTSNGTRNFEAPADADVNNTYVVQVTATDTAGNAANQTITVTVTDADEIAPTITSSATANVAENVVLAHSLTANETVTWSIVGGVDQSHFEISGSTLRWLNNGTKDFENPGDTGANNTYVVNVRATDLASNTADQAITITVTDVAEGVSNDWLLEDASGSWQLEDASGNWILEAA